MAPGSPYDAHLLAGLLLADERLSHGIRVV